MAGYEYFMDNGQAFPQKLDGLMNHNREWNREMCKLVLPPLTEQEAEE